MEDKEKKALIFLAKCIDVLEYDYTLRARERGVFVSREEAIKKILKEKKK